MIKIIALTEAGKHTGEQLKTHLPDAELLFKPKPFAEKVQAAFKQGDVLMMICATGIVVRTLAPVLQNKRDDPPVLVLDEAGKFVIPLLSGHQGGANKLAKEIAGFLGAQCVITTAKSYTESNTNNNTKNDTKPVYTVGMGCEKDCPEAELARLLQDCLQKAHISFNQLESINSIALKAEEAGLLSLAKTLDKPFNTWTADQLAQVESQLSTRSDYVYSVVGAYGVAEPAALFGAQTLTGEPAELVLSKQKTAKATCAIARSFLGEN